MYDYLFLVLITLNLLDIATTYIALNSSHGYERNPVVSYIIKKVGKLLGLFLLKISFLFIVYSLYYFSFIPINYNTALVGCFVAVYVLIVGNNIYVLKKISEIED